MWPWNTSRTTIKFYQRLDRRAPICMRDENTQSRCNPNIPLSSVLRQPFCLWLGPFQGCISSSILIRLKRLILSSTTGSRNFAWMPRAYFGGATSQPSKGDDSTVRTMKHSMCNDFLNLEEISTVANLDKANYLS